MWLACLIHEIETTGWFLNKRRTQNESPPVGRVPVTLSSLLAEETRKTFKNGEREVDVTSERDDLLNVYQGRIVFLPSAAISNC